MSVVGDIVNVEVVHGTTLSSDDVTLEAAGTTTVHGAELLAVSAESVQLEAATDGALRMGGDATVAVGDSMTVSATRSLDVSTGGKMTTLSDEVELDVKHALSASAGTLSMDVSDGAVLSVGDDLVVMAQSASVEGDGDVTVGFAGAGLVDVEELGLTVGTDITPCWRLC